MQFVPLLLVRFLQKDLGKISKVNGKALQKLYLSHLSRLIQQSSFPLLWLRGCSIIKLDYSAVEERAYFSSKQKGFQVFLARQCNLVKVHLTL